jgi:hypothetical protein
MVAELPLLPEGTVSPELPPVPPVHAGAASARRYWRSPLLVSQEEETMSPGKHGGSIASAFPEKRWLRSCRCCRRGLCPRHGGTAELPLPLVGTVMYRRVPLLVSQPLRFRQPLSLPEKRWRRAYRGCGGAGAGWSSFLPSFLPPGGRQVVEGEERRRGGGGEHTAAAERWEVGPPSFLPSGRQVVEGEGGEEERRRRTHRGCGGAVGGWSSFLLPSGRQVVERGGGGEHTAAAERWEVGPPSFLPDGK